MNKEKFLKAIIEEINCFDSQQMRELNNTYCDEKGYPDDHIFDNDEQFFEDNFNGNVMEAVRAVSFGDYSLSHDYVKYNGYGNLESMDGVNEDDLPVSIESIAEEVAENYSSYDHLFDLDEDDFEDEEEEEETDEDDNTNDEA